MGHERPLFVAETNERGEVVWVWRSEPKSGRARAVRTPARHLIDAEGAAFSGAPPVAIIDWLAKRSNSGDSAPS